MPTGVYRRITPTMRQAMVQDHLTGMSQASIASKHRVNRNTVSRAILEAKANGRPGIRATLDTSWRAKLANELPRKAVESIGLSLDDKLDVHRSAGTGLSLLKGLGILAGEGNSTVQILLQANQELPEDLRLGLIVTGSPSVPPAGAPPPPTDGMGLPPEPNL